MINDISRYKNITFLGINRGSAVYLYILKALNSQLSEDRKVAFYHRNTSDPRKAEILEDLKLPIGHPEKKIQCVIATVSLGNMND